MVRARTPAETAGSSLLEEEVRPVVGWLIAYAAVVLLLAMGAGMWLHDWAADQLIQSFSLTRLAASPTPPAAAPEQLVLLPPSVKKEGALPATTSPSASLSPSVQILLLGTDERPDEYSPPRTDTLILLSFNPDTGGVGMISMPRDLWVPIAGLNTPSKINTAYLQGELQGYPGGGPQLVKDTVSSFVGRPVDYFVRVNFDGFRQLIDLIGGVTVDVPYTIHDEEYPTADYGVETFHLEAGTHQLDGETALKYARTRHSDSDYGRARRQQELIRAVVDQITAAGSLPQLLSRVPQLLTTMQGSLQTDLPVTLAIELARRFQSTHSGDTQQLVLDNRYGEETFSSEGAWILLPDRARVRTALNAFFAAIETPPGTQKPALTDPAAIRIEVLNGTAQPGAAARTAQLLNQQGWQVAAIGDADRSDYLQTVVINYGVTAPVAARLLGDLQLDPEQAQINGLDGSTPVEVRIVVGRDLLALLK